MNKNINRYFMATTAQFPLDIKPFIFIASELVILTEIKATLAYGIIILNFK